MPQVKFTRNVTRGNFIFERYTVRDSNNRQRALVFRNNERVLNLPSGVTDIKVELSGNGGSRVTVSISPAGGNTERRFFEIPGNKSSVTEFREFEV